MSKSKTKIPDLEVSISVPSIIPGRHLKMLARKVRERFDLSSIAPVSAEDLLVEAGIQGLIDLPEQWSCLTDEEYTDKDLLGN